ncbi:MAG TPA: 16S rRNA (adenine(1518)-N(6)/adenine(1519)-N(6))-dimethyltransferase RsmA [Fimbriiglobus sp.]|jgi:16S rRNA (adenine1518-N6/adenine1519-N6)-dimethyltransferase
MLTNPPDPPAPSTRQTLSLLRRIFDSQGFDPKAKLGQNFLIDLNLVDLIARSADLTPDDCVLEVGTGTGSLTARLADRAGAVVTVEIDRALQPVAEQMCAGRRNVTFVRGDCLAKKSELNPHMLAEWDRVGKGYKHRKVVANLPYVIATPLVSNLLVLDQPIARLVIMVQWEIAERMAAAASTKDYNALSVLIQGLADVEIVRKVGPANFFPRPQVDSAIVRIVPNAEKRAKVGDVLKFRAFIRDLYTHRRKNLRQALIGFPRGRKDKTEVDAKLAELGLDGSIRAESLDVEQHIHLANAFG